MMQTDPSAIAALVLAAGLSTRMEHAPKALCHLGGVTLLERVVNTFRQSGIQNILVVTGHESPLVAAEAERLGCPSTYNEQYKHGMFSSIQHGFAHLLKKKEKPGSAFRAVQAALLLPVDIPLIQPKTLEQILHAWSATPKPDSTIAIPAVGNQLGHPPLVPLRYFSAIVTSPENQGMRSFLASLATPDAAFSIKQGLLPHGAPLEESGKIRFIPLTDRGILQDIDMPKDLEAAEAYLASQT